MYIIIGDFNVRIGELQTFPAEMFDGLDTVCTHYRHSKDKTVNKLGKKLIEFCDNNNLVILNGRINGDTDGQYTFMSSVGSSVNDLCCVSTNLLSSIKNFLVEAQIYSDHFPIVLNYYYLKKTDTNNSHLCPPRLKFNDKHRKFFTQHMEAECINVNDWPNDSNGLVDILQNKIKLISKKLGTTNNACYNKRKHFKKPWFDWDCETARSRSFKLLNLYRKTDSEIIKQMYISINKEYQKLLIDKEKNYRKKFGDDIASVKDSKEFWSLIKTLKASPNKQLGNISTEKWFTYFQALLNPTIPLNRIYSVEPLILIEELDRPFELNELIETINLAKPNKAPGIDGIPVEYYKCLPEIGLRKLLEVYNIMYESNTLPKTFKESLVYPLYKKGDRELVTNYRGISFLNTISKLFTGLLLSRLETFINNNKLISEYQSGFRKNYSTYDNIFNIFSIISDKLSYKRKKVYAFFVDFSSAFDSINRTALWYKLYKIGVSTKFINVIKNLYTETRATVWTRTGISDSFETVSGLKQGCNLSGYLFSIFINDLQDSLEGGLWFKDLNIRVLMYADDIVLLASDPRQLQNMINRLDQYCSQWSLNVNLNKSKIIIFRKGGKYSKNDKFFYQGEKIEIVNKYKYLGVTLTPGLSMDNHFAEKLTAAKFAINSTWGPLLSQNTVPYTTKLKVFSAVSRAIMCYASQVWGYQMYDTVESLLRFFIKKLFRLPINTPNYMLYLESNLYPIFTYTLKSHLKFINRILNLPEHRLGNLIISKTQSNKSFWIKGWENLEKKFNLKINVNNIKHDLNTSLRNIENNLKQTFRQHYLDSANKTTLHVQYSRLNINLVNKTYLSTMKNIADISWIFKVRGDLLYLNNRPYLSGNSNECTMCNLHQTENAFHFVAVCPVLKEFRVQYLRQRVLTRCEFEEYLNGKDWLALVLFCKNAWRYRHFLMENL
jgi:hypothetical protein